MAKILIIGGSLGGLLVANMLLQDGHDVHILEKTTGSMDGRGAGIVAHHSLFLALEQAGVVIDETLGVKIRQRVVLDLHGNTIDCLEAPQIVTSWSQLFVLLKANFPPSRYLQGKNVLHLTQDASVVEVRCDDGSQLQADLVIASDGLRSAIRQIQSPNIVPNYAGYIAWRGVCDESKLSKRTLETLFPYFGFCLPDGEQMLGYPVAGANNDTSAGKKRYNFVWYRSVPQNQLSDYLTDESGQLFSFGIAPTKIKKKFIQEMRQASEQLLAPQFAEIITHTEIPFFQAIYDVESDQIANGRVALMGDAAFVARPHVGMGVTKAGDDALSLLQHIRTFGATPKALEAYAAERFTIGQSLVARAQYLGRYMQSQSMSSTSDSHSGIRNTSTVLKETAVDLRHVFKPSITHMD